MINLPCTTRLSLDFFRSSVSISENTVRNTLCCSTRHTVATKFEIENIADFDVDDAEKTLVESACEFTLVKYLYGNHRRVGHEAI